MSICSVARISNHQPRYSMLILLILVRVANDLCHIDVNEIVRTLSSHKHGYSYTPLPLTICIEYSTGYITVHDANDDEFSWLTKTRNLRWMHCCLLVLW